MLGNHRTATQSATDDLSRYGVYSLFPGVEAPETPQAHHPTQAATIFSPAKFSTSPFSPNLASPNKGDQCIVSNGNTYTSSAIPMSSASTTTLYKMSPACGSVASPPTLNGGGGASAAWPSKDNAKKGKSSSLLEDKRKKKCWEMDSSASSPVVVAKPKVAIASPQLKSNVATNEAKALVPVALTSPTSRRTQSPVVGQDPEVSLKSSTPSISNKKEHTSTSSLRAIRPVSKTLDPSPSNSSLPMTSTTTSGIPVGIAVARQRSSASTNVAVTNTLTNTFPDLSTAHTAPCIPAMTLLTCDDGNNSNNSATWGPQWFNPVPMEPSMSQISPPSNLQLIRDPMSGQLMLLPTSSFVSDSMPRTVVWPSSAQTPQLILPPNTPQATPLILDNRLVALTTPSPNQQDKQRRSTQQQATLVKMEDNSIAGVVMPPDYSKATLSSDANSYAVIHHQPSFINPNFSTLSSSGSFLIQHISRNNNNGTVQMAPGPTTATLFNNPAARTNNLLFSTQQLPPTQQLTLASSSNDMKDNIATATICYDNLYHNTTTTTMFNLQQTTSVVNQQTNGVSTSTQQLSTTQQLVNQQTSEVSTQQLSTTSILVNDDPNKCNNASNGAMIQNASSECFNPSLEEQQSNGSNEVEAQGTEEEEDEEEEELIKMNDAGNQTDMPSNSEDDTNMSSESKPEEPHQPVMEEQHQNQTQEGTPYVVDNVSSNSDTLSNETVSHAAVNPSIFQSISSANPVNSNIVYQNNDITIETKNNVNNATHSMNEEKEHAIENQIIVATDAKPHSNSNESSALANGNVVNYNFIIMDKNESCSPVLTLNTTINHTTESSIRKPSEEPLLNESNMAVLTSKQNTLAQNIHANKDKSITMKNTFYNEKKSLKSSKTSNSKRSLNLLKNIRPKLESNCDKIVNIKSFVKNFTPEIKDDSKSNKKSCNRQSGIVSKTDSSCESNTNNCSKKKVKQMPSLYPIQSFISSNVNKSTELMTNNCDMEFKSMPLLDDESNSDVRHNRNKSKLEAKKQKSLNKLKAEKHLHQQKPKDRDHILRIQNDAMSSQGKIELYLGTEDQGEERNKVVDVTSKSDEKEMLPQRNECKPTPRILSVTNILDENFPRKKYYHQEDSGLGGNKNVITENLVDKKETEVPLRNTSKHDKTDGTTQSDSQLDQNVEEENDETLEIANILCSKLFSNVQRDCKPTETDVQQHESSAESGVDVSGLELLSNSIEQLEHQTPCDVKEIKDSFENNDSGFDNTPVRGLDVLCALAEERLLEENETSPYTSSRESSPVQNAFSAQSSPGRHQSPPPGSVSSSTRQSSVSPSRQSSSNSPSYYRSSPNPRQMFARQLAGRFKRPSGCGSPSRMMMSVCSDTDEEVFTQPYKPRPYKRPPGIPYKEVSHTYRSAKSEQDTRRVLASKQTYQYIPPTSVDLKEMETRKLLAEIQREFREAQKELTRLTPKKSPSTPHSGSAESVSKAHVEPSATNCVKRGPGRPRKVDKDVENLKNSGKKVRELLNERRSTSPTKQEKLEKDKHHQPSHLPPKPNIKLHLQIPPSAPLSSVSKKRLRSESPNKCGSKVQSPPVLTPFCASPLDVTDSARPPTLTPHHKERPWKFLLDAKKSGGKTGDSHHANKDKHDEMDSDDSTVQDPPQLLPESTTSVCKKRGRPPKAKPTLSVEKEPSPSPISVKKSAKPNFVSIILANKNKNHEKKLLDETEDLLDYKPNKIRPKLKAEVKVKSWENEDGDTDEDVVSDIDDVDTIKPISISVRKPSLIAAATHAIKKIKEDVKEEKKMNVSLKTKSKESLNVPDKDKPCAKKARRADSVPEPETNVADVGEKKTVVGSSTTTHKRNKRAESFCMNLVAPRQIHDSGNLPTEDVQADCKLTPQSLCIVENTSAAARVLVLKQGLLYAGQLTGISPPDIYGITLDGERAHRPTIYSQEEILNDVILEVKLSRKSITLGKRMCAYWSQQYRCLYPGVVVSEIFTSGSTAFVNVEFDDEDSGSINVEDIRMLPQDFPIMTYENPLLTLGGNHYKRKRRNSSTSCDDNQPPSKEKQIKLDATIEEENEDEINVAKQKVDKMEEESHDKEGKTSKHKIKKRKKSRDEKKEHKKHKKHKHKHRHKEKRRHSSSTEMSNSASSSVTEDKDLSPVSSHLDTHSDDAIQTPIDEPSASVEDIADAIVNTNEAYENDNSTDTIEPLENDPMPIEKPTTEHIKIAIKPVAEIVHTSDDCDGLKITVKKDLKIETKIVTESENKEKSKEIENEIESESNDSEALRIVESETEADDNVQEDNENELLCGEEHHESVKLTINTHDMSAKIVTEEKKCVEINEHVERESSSKDNVENETNITDVKEDINISELETKADDEQVDVIKTSKGQIKNESKHSKAKKKDKTKEKPRERQGSMEGRSKMTHFLPDKQLWNWYGDCYKRCTTKKKGKKLFYKSIQRGKECINVGDCAVFLSTETDQPYIGKIDSFWQSYTSMNVKVKWFYHPEETVGCPENIPCYHGALFEACHFDENDIQTISHKCQVLPIDKYKKTIAKVKDTTDIYYLAGLYDHIHQKIHLEPEVSPNGPK